MNRLARAAYWTIPPLFCLAVHWLGLKAWFQQDDFAWLGLRHDVAKWPDWFRVLFAPMAQGTIRPWSERLFFLLFEAVFGVEALPFRLWVCATQMVNLVLLSWIVGRVTRSRLAGFLAPVLWTASSALGRPMTWTSVYNQVLCAFFLLAAFHFLLRAIETGERRWWLWQWAAFLAGFGALELNVVYPALAALYTLACARRCFRRTLPLFVPSVLFAVIHRLAAPAVTSGPYVAHLDASMLGTFLRYCHIALGSEHAGLIPPGTGWPPAVAAGVWLLGAVLVAFTAWELARRRWVAGFFAGWFALTLAPVLPLRDHVTEYYLAVPMIGLASLGAWAAARGWSAGWRWRPLAAACLLVWFTTALPAARAVSRLDFERSRAARNLVLGVVEIRQRHPAEVILLTGVETDLFWSAILDNPFRLFGVKEVYLAPGSEDRIRAFPELGSVTDWVFPTRETWRVLGNYGAVVYDASGPRLRNVTDNYMRILGALELQARVYRVDVAQPAFERLLGPTWWAVEGGSRFMPRRATVRMSGPRAPGQKLYLSFWVPERLLAQGPARLSVSANGIALPAVTLAQGGVVLEPAFDLPPQLVGVEWMEIAVECERVFRAPPDVRDLSLRFGTFTVR
jgi:hypothetical protein